MFLILRGEHALDDGLIAAPIPDAQHRIAEQNGIPREAGRIVRRARHAEKISRAPGDIAPGHAGERMRIRRERVREFRPAADFQIAHDRHHHRADEQQNGLHAFRPHHREQAADHRVNAREHAEHDDEQHKRVHAHDRCAGREAENAAQHPRRRVKRHAHVNHDGREQRDDGEHIATAAIEAAFEKVRQRGDLRAQVERREKQRQQNQREARHPLEVAEDEAVFVSRFGQADEMHGGDVRREHRKANHRPRERVAGEEIVSALTAGRAFAPPKSRRHAKADDRQQVDDDDAPVQSGHWGIHAVIIF